MGFSEPEARTGDGASTSTVGAAVSGDGAARRSWETLAVKASSDAGASDSIWGVMGASTGIGGQAGATASASEASVSETSASSDIGEDASIGADGIAVESAASERSATRLANRAPSVVVSSDMPAPAAVEAAGRMTDMTLCADMGAGRLSRDRRLLRPAIRQALRKPWARCVVPYYIIEIEEFSIVLSAHPVAARSALLAAPLRFLPGEPGAARRGPRFAP